MPASTSALVYVPLTLPHLYSIILHYFLHSTVQHLKFYLFTYDNRKLVCLAYGWTILARKKKLFGLLVYPQYVDQRLAQSSCSVNVCRIRECAHMYVPIVPACLGQWQHLSVCSVIA